MTQPLHDLNYSILLDKSTYSESILTKEVINSSAIKVEVQLNNDIYPDEGSWIIRVNVSNKCSYNVSDGIHINSKS